jgi:hypothetical protein
VSLAQRGIVLGVAWSGIEGAGNQIVAAKIECSKARPKLVQVWRPFQDAPGRRDVREGFARWLSEEARWAEGRLTVGLDFPFSLAETHLRQLGLLRQALRGPASLGRGLEERFLPSTADFSEASEAFKAQLGKDRLRLADCYRATVFPPSHLRLYRGTFFGLNCLSQVADVSFLPWDPPKAGKPSLVEVRPEHVARVLSGTCAYRDDTRDGGAADDAHGVRRRVRDGGRREGGGGREGARARRRALGRRGGGGAGGQLPRRSGKRAAQRGVDLLGARGALERVKRSRSSSRGSSSR